MKRVFAITVALLFALLSSFATDVKLPDVKLDNKDVVVYSWSNYVPQKTYPWNTFSFVDHYGGNVDTIIATGDYYQNLYKLISAGEMIDASVAEALSFPALIMRGLVQP